LQKIHHISSILSIVKLKCENYNFIIITCKNVY